MPRPGEKSVQPYTREDQQLDTFNRQARAAFADVYRQLEAQNRYGSRIMPADAYTALWWPLDDAAYLPTPTAFRNQGINRGSADMLTLGPGALMSPTGGLLAPACLRLNGAASTNRWATGAPGMDLGQPPHCTISAWVRLGTSANNQIIAGYMTPGGVSVGAGVLYRGADGLLRCEVISAAGSRTAVMTGDVPFTDSQWHHVWSYYDGVEVGVGVDGIAASSGPFAYSPLNWAGATPAWFVGGISGSTNNAIGLVQDVRVLTVPRKADWGDEVWRRGRALFATEARL